MGKQLAILSADLKDIQSRVNPMLKTMDTLDNNFWNDTTGNWGRYYVGLDLLAERLRQLNAQDASAPAAAGDALVQKILAAIASDKADCKRISTEYWGTAARVEAIAREVEALKTKVDKVIKDKDSIFKKSKSLPDLQALSRELATFKNTLGTALLRGPHKPNHALLQ